MDKLKKLRGVERSGMTKLITNLEADILKQPIPRDDIITSLQMLERKVQNLMELDEKVKDLLLDKEDTTTEILEEMEAAADEYIRKATKAKIRAEDALNPRPRTQALSVHSGQHNSMSIATKSKMKLPKIELKKFAGEFTEWLGWWAQFQRIDNDEELDDAEKFIYLTQAMVKGSRAEEVIKRYPESGVNYPKAIAALQERFGKKKILKQVYVRKLIQLILENRSNQKMPLYTLYDQLEASLGSLESLGVEKENMVEFLFPMVESSLPEDILLAWQRSANFGRDGSRLDPPQSELDFLMSFLQFEVENEEQRRLVKSGFSTTNDKRRGQKQKDPTDDDIPTAAGLLNGVGEKSKKPSCIFCGKSHSSSECYGTQKMTLEERKEVIKKKRACFNCLGVGHISSKCKKGVKCLGCGKKHLIILCPDISPKSKSSPEEQVETVQSNLNCTSSVLLRTLIVDLENPQSGRKTKVRVLLDCGSQRSYLLEKTAKGLGLNPIQQLKINHELFGGSEVLAQDHFLYEVKLSTTKGKGISHFSFHTKLMDQPRICGTIPRIPNGDWLSELKKKGIQVNDANPNNPMEIEVLLGADYLGEILTGGIYKLADGLTATETKFGWTLMGQWDTGRTLDNLALSVISMTVSSACVNELWGLEILGIRDPLETKSQEQKEQEAHDQFLKTVRQGEDGKYTVSLPWVNGSEVLPSNRAVALKRLEGTTKKLVMLQKVDHYNRVFEEWEAEGIISRVEDTDDNYSKCHYLPHRAVFKNSITTPVRPVFDASCKVGRNPSLNDCLEKGPNLLEVIPAILLRFRMGEIGVTADIRKAFLMIEISDSDRDFLRFLWWKDSDHKELQVFRHNRVVFGMNCSPFLLGAVISYHLYKLKTPMKKLKKSIQESLYVDNLVVTVRSVAEFETLKAHATDFFLQANMELRQWECTGTDGDNRVSSVLGLKWDRLTDSLFCEIPQVQIPTTVTKRVILSLIQRVFDPLGFLSPILIGPKILLQQIWKQNRKWDEKVSEEAEKEFLRWWEELTHCVTTLQVPRNCNGGRNMEEGKFQLHVFCDASGKAYATAVFLRVETQEGVKVQLLQSKARVAPLGKSTIPRMELLACAIAARLSTSVKKALKMEGVPTYYWTDSTSALWWIRNSDQWGTFVGNRVKEILELTDVKYWYHVPGHINPADLPSRGTTPSKFVKLRWWEGPDWLRSEKENWPNENSDVDMDIVNKERKKTISTFTNSVSVKNWYIVKNCYFQNLRIIAYVFRFLDSVMKKPTEMSKYPSRSELLRTELRLFKIVQKETFKGNESVISGLRVEKDDDDIIRVKTKLIHRKDTEGFRKPVLMPNSHELVDILILTEHIMSCHGGAQYLMSKLREKVWVIHGRKAVRSVLHKCVICRRFDSRKSEVPGCALPEDRVKDAKAFEVTGIDLAGPLTLKDKSKVYIVLYTCAIYRCVHLELVDTLSTEGFLLSFIRFCKRKRRPSVIYTDNGKNFVGGQNLFRSVDWDAVVRRTGQGSIDWKFNPPSAPWWGGWWERLVRSTKDLLRKMMGFSKLNYVEMETCLCEVEEVVNHRPLTFVSEDQNDLIPLTPAMFIADLPFEDVPEAGLVSVESFQQKRKNLGKLLEEIRKRFRTEYLGLLVQRGQNKRIREFKVGEVVLVEDDRKQKRIFWKMARIEELIPGKDGVVRVVRLKTKNGCLTRPIQRIFPLEVSGDEFSSNVKGSDSVLGKTQTTQNTEISKEVARVTRSGRNIKTPIRFCDYE